MLGDDTLLYFEFQHNVCLSLYSFHYMAADL